MRTITSHTGFHARASLALRLNGLRDNEGNGEYKHVKIFILFANENPAGEDYLDLLKRACHREIIYEAKSSDFGPALKVNLAALQRMVLCAIQKQLLDNASTMTVSDNIIALDEVRLNRIKTLIVEYGRDACVFSLTVRTVIRGAGDHQH